MLPLRKLEINLAIIAQFPAFQVFLLLKFKQFLSKFLGSLLLVFFSLGFCYICQEALFLLIGTFWPITSSMELRPCVGQVLRCLCVYVYLLSASFPNCTYSSYDPYDSLVYYMTKIPRANSRRKPFLEYFRFWNNKTNYQGKKPSQKTYLPLLIDNVNVNVSGTWKRIVWAFSLGLSQEGKLKTACGRSNNTNTKFKSKLIKQEVTEIDRFLIKTTTTTVHRVQRTLEQKPKIFKKKKLNYPSSSIRWE